MLRIQNAPAYILHTYPYRETSLLLDVFIQQQGRLSVIAKGAKRPQSRIRSLLQPFVPLLISCSGRGELLTLNNVDPNTSQPSPYVLLGQRLISGFYINELIIRLLHRHDPHPELFEVYQNCLNSLKNTLEYNCEQTLLRIFEKQLLKCIGYDLQLIKESDTGVAILEDAQYWFDPERGPISLPTYTASQKIGKTHSILVEGSSLVDLEQGSFRNKRSLMDAKKITRHALNLHLGLKPLETRRLLTQLK